MRVIFYSLDEQVGEIELTKGGLTIWPQGSAPFDQYHGTALMHCNHVRKTLNSCTWQDLRYMSSRCLRPTSKA